MSTNCWSRLSRGSQRARLGCLELVHCGHNIACQWEMRIISSEGTNEHLKVKALLYMFLRTRSTSLELEGYKPPLWARERFRKAEGQIRNFSGLTAKPANSRIAAFGGAATQILPLLMVNGSGMQLTWTLADTGI
jgi:hypothetical protein